MGIGAMAKAMSVRMFPTATGYARTPCYEVSIVGNKSTDLQTTNNTRENCIQRCTAL